MTSFIMGVSHLCKLLYCHCFIIGNLQCRVSKVDCISCCIFYRWDSKQWKKKL